MSIDDNQKQLETLLKNNTSPNPSGFPQMIKGLLQMLGIVILPKQDVENLIKTLKEEKDPQRKKQFKPIIKRLDTAINSIHKL